VRIPWGRASMEPELSPSAVMLLWEPF